MDTQLVLGFNTYIYIVIKNNSAVIHMEILVGQPANGPTREPILPRLMSKSIPTTAVVFPPNRPQTSPFHLLRISSPAQ